VEVKFEAGWEMTGLWRGGTSPKDIPHWAYRYLVVCLKAEPERLSRLKCVEEFDYLEKRPVHLIRIFDPGEAQGVEIRDFASLDRHPELMLYEGHRDMESEEVAIFPLKVG
jgi:hypothetical protein